MTVQMRQVKNCKVAEAMLSTKVQQRYTAQVASLDDQDQQSKMEDVSSDDTDQ